MIRQNPQGPPRTPDETYIHQERIAILVGDGDLDLDTSDMALDDVERFRSEVAAQERAEQLRKQPKRNL